jgi:hypothetical protein
VSAGEGRTVAELLDDSDGSAREALRDMSPDRALGMVRGWPQLMQSAAALWAVLPPDPTVSANHDQIAILAAMGRAVGRSVAAGHWRGAAQHAVGQSSPRWLGSSWSTSSVRMMDRNLTLRGGSAGTPSAVCSHPRSMFGALKRSHGLVGRRSDIGGGVD